MSCLRGEGPKGLATTPLRPQSPRPRGDRAFAGYSLWKLFSGGEGFVTAGQAPLQPASRPPVDGDDAEDDERHPGEMAQLQPLVEDDAAGAEGEERHEEGDDEECRRPACPADAEIGYVAAH